MAGAEEQNCRIWANDNNSNKSSHLCNSCHVKAFTSIGSLQPCETRTIALVLPFVQMGQPRHREVKRLAQGHTACEWQGFEPRHLGPESVPLTLRGPVGPWVASSHWKGGGRGEKKGSAKSGPGLHRTIARCLTVHIHTFAHV